MNSILNFYKQGLPYALAGAFLASTYSVFYTKEADANHYLLSGYLAATWLISVPILSVPIIYSLATGDNMTYSFRVTTTKKIDETTTTIKD